jgi:hypothetical protein
MTENHPITPPPDKIHNWLQSEKIGCTIEQIITAAAQWGADQELLACGNYLKQCAAWEEEDVTEFYNYRRPKPPSLKEQALKALQALQQRTTDPNIVEPLRRALEQLDD